MEVKRVGRLGSDLEEPCALSGVGKFFCVNEDVNALQVENRVLLVEHDMLVRDGDGCCLHVVIR